MALGDRLVRELELHQSVNTLARWTAHHLAEVILKARNSEGPEKAAAEAKAVELILKLWASRHDLPGGAHPLKQFEGVIKVLRQLEPESWPYGRARGDHISERLEDAFYGLQTLVILGLILPHANRPTDVDADDDRFLEEDERAVVDRVREWLEFAKSEKSSIVSVRFVTDETLKEMEAEELELAKLDPDAQIRRRMSRRIKGLLQSLSALEKSLDSVETGETTQATD